MRTFVCNDHKGWWPVPTASVVIAENKEQAFQLLKEKLKNSYDVDDDSFTLKEIDTTKIGAIVLSYGDY